MQVRPLSRRPRHACTAPSQVDIHFGRDHWLRHDGVGSTKRDERTAVKCRHSAATSSGPASHRHSTPRITRNNTTAQKRQYSQDRSSQSRTRLCAVAGLVARLLNCGRGAVRCCRKGVGHRPVTRRRSHACKSLTLASSERPPIPRGRTGSHATLPIWHGSLRRFLHQNGYSIKIDFGVFVKQIIMFLGTKINSKND